jgi:hypothetical protein
MARAAGEVTPSAALRGRMMLYVLGHPGRLTEFLGEDVAPPVAATGAGPPLAGLPVRRRWAAWLWPWSCAACAPKDTQLRRA